MPSTLFKEDRNISFTIAAMIGFISGLVTITVIVFAAPFAKMYIAKYNGKAKLMQAEYDRQAMIKEANTKVETAKILAQAEIEKAKGTAEANKILSECIKQDAKGCIQK